MDKQMKKIMKLTIVIGILLLVYTFASVASVTGLFNKGEKPAVTTTAATTVESTTEEEQTTAGVVSVDAIKTALGSAGATWDGKVESLTNEQKTAVINFFAGLGSPVELKLNFFFVEGQTETQTETTVQGTANAAGTTIPGQTTTAASVNAKPTTNAEILAAYTAVMNKAKTDKPGFTKYEYQALPENERNIGGAVKYLLPLAENFMTTEDKAKSNAGVEAKGQSMNGFPVKNSSKGCMLTDVGVIKSAACDVLANGNYKITIVLNDETNPEPLKDGQTKAASNTGNMFTPLGKSEIDNELQNNSTVKAVVKSADYSMLYRNSKTTLEYNPKTSQVVSVDQYMNIFLTLSGKIIILGTSSGTAVLEMFYKAYDFKY